MNIGEIMSRELVTVGATQTLRQAAEVMSSYNVGAVIVSSEDQPGILSERDILKALGAGVDIDQITVADRMTANAVTAFPTWDVDQAVRTMLEGGFRHLVVVDGGRPVGMLSIRDLAAHLSGASPATSRT